jgi:ADP-sugar diphosphatase
MNQCNNTDMKSSEKTLLALYNLLYVIIILSVFIIYQFSKFPTRKWAPARKWFALIKTKSIEIIPAHQHLEISMDSLIIAPKFINWLNKFNPQQIKVNSVTITDINWFSAKPEPNKLGFVKCTVDAIDVNSNKKIVSNIAFIRGNSVAILIIVKIATPKTKKGKSNSSEKETEYVLLCEQMRLPVGERKREICAGMTDADGNIASVALKEVKEETGFDIKNVSDLVPLGSIYPSPGGCDEEIHLYSWTTTISKPEFIEKQTKVFGNPDEYEEVKLSFVEINEFMTTTLREIGDVKAECALFRHLLNDEK